MSPNFFFCLGLVAISAAILELDLVFENDSILYRGKLYIGRGDGAAVGALASHQ